MEKLHGTWKNIWVDYKSLHARGRPQVLYVCLLSGGWNNAASSACTEMGQGSS